MTLIVTLLMAGMAYTQPVLVEDETNSQRESDSNEVTPEHIELWSASSTENPLIPMEDCVLSDMVVDSSGNTYVTGSFKEKIQFGDTILSNSGYAMFVAQLHSNGIWGWAVQSTGTDVRSHALTLDDAEQNLFVVGSAIFNNTFGPYPFVTNETSLFVTSVSTLDGTFNYLRTPVYGNSSAQSVIARPGGGVHVSGTHFNDLRLPNLSFVPPATFEDAFVASMDGEGNWLWITSTSCD